MLRFKTGSMNLWIALAVSVAVAAWIAPGLWNDFRAGIIFPGSVSVKRSEHPTIYWLGLAVQATLIVAWAAATVILALAVARGDIPN